MTPMYESSSSGSSSPASPRAIHDSLPSSLPSHPAPPARDGAEAAASVIPEPSYPSGRRRPGQTLGPQQQDDDEDGEHRHRGEDASDPEFRRLLKKAEPQPADHRAAIRPHAAQRHRHEAVEVQDRLVAEEGE